MAMRAMGIYMVWKIEELEVKLEMSSLYPSLISYKNNLKLPRHSYVSSAPTPCT